MYSRDRAESNRHRNSCVTEQCGRNGNTSNGIQMRRLPELPRVPCVDYITVDSKRRVGLLEMECNEHWVSLVSPV